MSDFWTRFNARVAAQPLLPRMTSAGFEAAPNGGNCEAWRKLRASGGYVLVCTDACGFDVEHPDDVWLVGAYSSDDDEGVCEEFADIDAALTYAATL